MNRRDIRSLSDKKVSLAAAKSTEAMVTLSEANASRNRTQVLLDGAMAVNAALKADNVECHGKLASLTKRNADLESGRAVAAAEALVELLRSEKKSLEAERDELKAKLVELKASLDSVPAAQAT